MASLGRLRALMVRRGSTVRVRLRAFRRSLLNANFLGPFATRSGGASMLRQHPGQQQPRQLVPSESLPRRRLALAPTKLVDHVRVLAQQGLQSVTHLTRDLG